jgi:alpha-galactosidase
MIQIVKDTRPWFFLQTTHSTYGMRVMETGHLEHLYYGERITVDTQDPSSCAPLVIQRAFAPGNTCIYTKEQPQISMEDVCLEVGTCGKGDIREPFLEVCFTDGSVTSDFTFVSFEVLTLKDRDERMQASGLPHSYSEEESSSAKCLHIILQDATNRLELQLFYTVYEDCDVITRSACLLNRSDTFVTIERCMSAQLDLTEDYSEVTHFSGAWAREMHREQITLSSGKFVNSSYTGTSSNRANPFVILSPENTCETSGSCIGCNLIYSGNHYEALEKDSYGKFRFVAGINPRSFSWQLAPGEVFYTPEAVLNFSADGFRGLSGQLHSFIREHIVRGVWKHKPRPVLLNSWEACYFKIDEKKLLQLAKAGKDAGIELFVMDDGWFLGRNNDTSSLGDWEPDPKKLPGGIASLSKKIKELGMDFGIWVEPEMISENSNLYKEHPDWAMKIPGHPHSEGRNQCILDLCNPEVRKYVIEEMTRVFSSGEIRYVKWDMNRNFSDIYSPYLPAAKQGETAHRYVLGLYQIMEELTTRFPKILFEGCSAGGNRFDLGILCYFPQIWASDNTDALCRTGIQNSYSYGYPLSVFTAHVSSCPNHQTLRITPLETRFQVASFGILGYECNLKDLSGSDLNAIREQIAFYKKWRDVFQFGSFYRGAENEASDSETLSWTCVSPDGRRAVGLFFRRLTVPNQSHDWYRPVGLLPDVKYHFYGRNIKYNLKDFGDLVNTVSPIHIKQGSALQEILSRFVNMDGEKEDLTAYGDTLMRAGIALKPAFAGTGYNSDTRLFPDFSSRIYFMEAVE